MVGYGKLNEDGTLQSATLKHDGMVSLDCFEKDKDSNYYKFYDVIAIDGKYKPSESHILSKAKEDKIKAIDAQTSLDIIALSGDIYKQLEKTIEHQILVRKKADGEIVNNVRIAELEALSGEVLNLKYNGNNREATVALVEITTTLENALAEIEGI